MRSPGSAFDVRAALSDEVRDAIRALGGGDAQAVHDCRVKLKRARALARVGHAVAPGLAAVFNDSARAIMALLAEARDLAALAKASRRLAKRSKKRAKAALETASAAFDDARKTAAAIDLGAVDAGLRDLLALAQVWPEASPRQVKRGARYVARRARRAWRKGRGRDAAVEKRHEWRHREKDRLYASSLLEDAWPRRHRCARSERLVNLLGCEHDLTLLSRKLEGCAELAGGEQGAVAAIAAIKTRRKTLIKRARAVAEQLHQGRA